MLELISNHPEILIVTHVIAAMVGGCLGVLAAALCVAARGPQYRPPKYDPESDTDPSHYWGPGK